MKSVFFVGLGLGVAAGILFAARSGKETREIISEKAAAGRRYAEETAQDIRDRANARIEEGKETIRRQKKAVACAAEAAKDTYNREIQNPNEETIISDNDSKKASA